MRKDADASSFFSEKFSNYCSNYVHITVTLNLFAKKKKKHNYPNGNILQRIVAKNSGPTTRGQSGCLGQTFDHAIRHLAALYLVSILISLSLVWWGNVHRGQPRDKEGDTERWRERTLAREEKIRGKINVTRTRELY